MPSILIETGFLTHPTEEKFLASDEGQDKIAEGIYRAFRLYKGDVESDSKGKEDKEIKKSPDTVKEPESVKGAEVSKNDKLKDGGNVVKAVEETKKNPETVFPQKTTYEKKKKSTDVDSLNFKNDKTISSVKDNEKADIVFKVQLGSSVKQDISNKNYKRLKDVKSEKLDNGMFYYYYGQTKDFKEIVEKQSEARKKGFKEAFVVAFNNGKRIAINEALSLIKKK